MTTNTEHRRRETDKIDGYCAKYELEKANARIAELEKLTQWKPISEAPKEWDYILGFEDGYGIKITWWDRSHDGAGGWRNSVHGWRPTHWMPLPPPPTVNQDE